MSRKFSTMRSPDAWTVTAPHFTDLRSGSWLSGIARMSRAGAPNVVQA